MLLVRCGLAPVLAQILEAWETILKLTFPDRATNLSTFERKQVLLVRCGLAPVLAQILESWEPATHTDRLFLCQHPGPAVQACQLLSGNRCG